MAIKHVFTSPMSDGSDTQLVRPSNWNDDHAISSTELITNLNADLLDGSHASAFQAAGTYVTSVTGTAPVASSGGTTPAISMPVATSLADGYLSSVNWTTFNNKENALTFAATDFDRVVDAISIDYTNGQAASGTLKGFLTSADWTTFNGKQAGHVNLTSFAGLTYVSTSFVKMSGANTFSLDTNAYSLTSHNHSGVYEPTDADLTAIAALGFTSTSFLKKTAADTWALDTNTYLTGNQTITLSGDVSGSGATAITTAIGADKITEAMLKAVDTALDEDILTYESTTGDFEWHSASEVKTAMSLNLVENTALSTWVGTTNVTTLGTIVTGTWNGTDIAVLDGGTGASTTQAAINTLTAVAGATNEHVLTKDTATGNAIFKVAGGGGATTALSNLAAVAINLSLISDTANTDDLGSSTIGWKHLYLDDANTTAPTTIGQINYNSTNARFEFCEATVDSFNPVTSLERIYRIGQVQTTVATLQTLATLPVLANKTYIIEAFIVWSVTATATGIKLSAQGPTGFTLMAGSYEISAANGTPDSSNFNANDVVVTTTASTFLDGNIAALHCILRTGGSDGNFLLRFALETAGEQITVNTDSYIRYRIVR